MKKIYSIIHYIILLINLLLLCSCSSGHNTGSDSGCTVVEEHPSSCSSGHNTGSDSGCTVIEEHPMYRDIYDTTNYDGPDIYIIPVDTLRDDKSEMERKMDSIKLNFPPGRVSNYIMLQHDTFIYSGMPLVEYAYLAIGLEQADGAFGETLSYVLYTFKDYPAEGACFMRLLSQLPQSDEKIATMIHLIMYEWSFELYDRCFELYDRCTNEQIVDFLQLNATEQAFISDFPFLEGFNITELLGYHTWAELVEVFTFMY